MAYRLKKNPEADEELFSGILYKCGGNIKSWKKRIMVLRKDHKIAYYKELSKPPLGMIHLDDGYMTFREGKPDDCKWPKSVDMPRTIVLVTSRRTFYLYGDTLGVMDQWRERLNNEYKILKQSNSTVGGEVGRRGEDPGQGTEHEQDKEDANTGRDENNEAHSNYVNERIDVTPDLTNNFTSSMAVVGLYATLRQDTLTPTSSVDSDSERDSKSPDSNGDITAEDNQELYIEPENLPNVGTVKRVPNFPIPSTPLEADLPSELYEPLEEQQGLYESLPLAEPVANGTADKHPSSIAPPLPPRPSKMPSTTPTTSNSNLIQQPPPTFEPVDDVDEFYAAMDEPNSSVHPPATGPVSTNTNATKLETQSLLTKSVLPKDHSDKPATKEFQESNSEFSYEVMTSPMKTPVLIDEDNYDIPSDALEQFREAGLNGVYTDMQPCAEDFKTIPGQTAHRMLPKDDPSRCHIEIETTQVATTHTTMEEEEEAIISPLSQPQEHIAPNSLETATSNETRNTVPEGNGDVSGGTNHVVAGPSESHTDEQGEPWSTQEEINPKAGEESYKDAGIMKHTQSEGGGYKTIVVGVKAEKQQEQSGHARNSVFHPPHEGTNDDPTVDPRTHQIDVVQPTIAQRNELSFGSTPVVDQTTEVTSKPNKIPTPKPRSKVPSNDSSDFEDSLAVVVDSLQPSRLKRSGSDMFKRRRERFLQEKTSGSESGVFRGSFSVTDDTNYANLQLQLEQQKHLLEDEETRLEQERRKLELEKKNLELEWELLRKERAEFEIQKKMMQDSNKSQM